MFGIIILVIITFLAWFLWREVYCCKKDRLTIITGKNVWRINGLDAISQYGTYRFEYRGRDFLSRICENEDIFYLFKNGIKLTKENNEKLNKLAIKYLKEKDLYYDPPTIGIEEILSNKIDEAYRRQ
jgi:hypothetical protein